MLQSTAYAWSRLGCFSTPIVGVLILGTLPLQGNSGPSASTSGGREFNLVAPDKAHWTLGATPDHTHSFQSSTNLKDWEPAGPFPPLWVGANETTFLVELDPGQPMAAYRILYNERPPRPEPIASLAAPGSETVAQHLPSMGMPFEAPDEVELIDEALPVSLVHVLAVVDPASTVQSLNALLGTENLTISGAEPLMDLVLLRSQNIMTLEALNALVERLRATGLFTAVSVNMAMSHPILAQEPGLRQLSARAQSTDLDWEWEVTGMGLGKGGNSPFEMSRVPQMWNWLDYGHRQKAVHGGHDVAVIEFAFSPHNDLDLENKVTLGTPSNLSISPIQYDHGLMVVGVIAARHDAQGIQGVTPLPDQVIGIPFLDNDETDAHSYASVDLGQLASLLSGPRPPKVINISLGMPWHTIGDPETEIRDTGEIYAEWMKGMGELWAGAFQSLNSHLSTTDYLVVCSAGNDSGGSIGDVDAKHNSPMAYIACTPSLNAVVPQFITVENVTSDRITNALSNYDKSGTGHSVSAGGTNMTTLFGPGLDDYAQNISGTSVSATMVTGMASFLWSLDPTLTVEELKSLLLSEHMTHEVQSGQRGNLVDGFAAALGIDLLRGNHDLQRALVDVDDGTLDGNLRMELMHFSEDPDVIHTADGRRGDGVVNMKDFRVFRDAWLQVIGETDSLDGPPTHFKRDLNFDGLVFDQPVSPGHPAPYEIEPPVGQSLSEALYSRYDYNGNGLLDKETQRYNPSAEAVSPFKVDPDTPVTKRDVRAGLLRDVDVLLDPAIWEQDEENVFLSGSLPGVTLIFDQPPDEWSHSYITDFSAYSSYLNYLWSFDLHVDMDAGEPDSRGSEYFDHPIYPMHDGLGISSLNRLDKARRKAWEGVITIPFIDTEDIWHSVLSEDYPWVTIHYKKTVGDEFHQYIINFRPEPGEDIGLSVGFGELQFYSNTRDFSAFYVEPAQFPGSQEIIARTPAGGPVATFFVPSKDNNMEYIRNEARDVAIAAYADRLVFPVALNGSPDIQAIYRSSGGDDSGTFYDVYGIRATYTELVGLPKDR